MEYKEELIKQLEEFIDTLKGIKNYSSKPIIIQTCESMTEDYQAKLEKLNAPEKSEDDELAKIEIDEDENAIIDEDGNVIAPLLTMEDIKSQLENINAVGIVK